MAIYIFNIFSVFLWYVFVNILNVKGKDKVFSIIITVQLFLIATLRDFSIGFDTHNYVYRFLIIKNSSWDNLFLLSDSLDFEIGFVVFNKIISIFTSNPRVFLGILNLVILVSLSIFIQNYSKIVWFSYFIFITLGFWGSTLNIVRQFLAIVILLNSLYYVRHNKIFKFVITVILASTFHLSALSFIVVYPISKIKIKKIYPILLGILSLFVYYFSSPIIMFVMNNFGYDHLSNRLGEGSGLGMLLLLYLIFCIAVIFKDNAIKHDDFFEIFIHILALGVIMNILALDFAMFGRTMLYFTIINIVLLPNLVYSFRVDYLQYYGRYFLIIGLLYFYIFRILIVDGGGIVPYVLMDF